ncbi:hypothetical protein ACWDSJ_02905 [Nocardia sp. NPDC003482]
MIGFFWTFVFAAVGSLVIYPLIAYWPSRTPKHNSVDAIRERIEREAEE